MKYIAVVMLLVVYVGSVSGQQPAPPSVQGSGAGPAPSAPYFYVPQNQGYGYAGSGYYYPYAAQGFYHPYVGSDSNFAFEQGRRAERYRQNAFEARRRLEAYRQRNQLPSEPSLAPPNAPGSGSSIVSDAPWESYHRFGADLEYYKQQELAAREELTLHVHRDFLPRGITEFREGRYGEAARSFTAAADKDHGDAASRLHAAQSFVAVGMYPEALEYFRRAFDLQPKLLNMPLNLQADYGRPGDYVEHVTRLQAYCKANEKDGSAWLVLAIEQFFGPNPGSAADAVANAKRLLAKDDFTHQFVRTAEPMLRGAAEPPPSPKGKT
jgi:tetratricopeptide (TPR) repeat protein